MKRLEPDYRSVGEALLDEASAISADLLVMGAYSQSRLRDRVPGGVTKAILNHSDLPLLMARLYCSGLLRIELCESGEV